MAQVNPKLKQVVCPECGRVLIGIYKLDGDYWGTCFTTTCKRYRRNVKGMLQWAK